MSPLPCRAVPSAEVGEDLAVALTSEDILHGFTIDDLDAHLTADRGQTAEGGCSALRHGRPATRG